MLDAKTFESLKISLATPADIEEWSFGEVKKPETINYRTLRPEKDGLFCERIFGPTKDWECNCGKYKRVRYKGIICERCGVEVTRSKVRRERMGHIDLAAPVTHIWYFKGVPSRLGYLLNLAPKDLEKVIYFAAYMITSVDEAGRREDEAMLRDELEVEKKRMANARDNAIGKRMEALEAKVAELEAADAKKSVIEAEKKAADREMGQIRRKWEAEIERLEQVWERFRDLKVGDLEGDERIYRAMVTRYGTYFEGGMGAEAIQKRLLDFDLESEVAELREIIASGTGQKKTRAIKRLKVVNAFLATGNSPASMVLDKLPVIPPDIRPMVQLDGGRFATSDLNDLYRRVINRNNRLKRLLELDAPEIIINNEKRMLQESVDALFDNGRRGRPVQGAGNRPLKSISDMLKGKQGRFRQNLLGKRVDYSGRSVIVVGPQLKLHQCGLPKQMALELFQPFVIKRLVDKNFAQNQKAARRKVERQHPVVWDVLDEVIREHPVLLNRAPTLHRLGIQAFEPQLIEGKAIQLHPLACTAFNADFDGDQMAVHLPLGAEAQAEARILMLSTNNILKPSDGRPVAMPAQDMVYGIFYLTAEHDAEYEATLGDHIPAYSSVAEAIMAFDAGQIDLNRKINLRFTDLVPPKGWEAPEGWSEGQPVELVTTLGRALFNEALPVDYPYVNEVVKKGLLSEVVNELAENYPNVLVAECLDALKAAGFHWATWSGVTIAFSDIQGAPNKAKIMAEYEEKAARVQAEADMGMIGEQERYEELVDIWTECTAVVAKDMRDSFSPTNTVYRMVDSGARGNWSQIQQIAGMRGLVSDPKQKLIENPIKASYREGLTVAEYFIATHGARKGTADTALRTAESGYLTRRLVDVSQDVIVREEDCGTRMGIDIDIATRNEDGTWSVSDIIGTTAYARTLARDAVNEAGEVIAEAGSDVGDVLIEKLVAAGVHKIRVRSVLTCDSLVGACAACYGRSLASGKRVDIGEAVGIIAAQSIGEPGTQLTMRTFHTGGAASGGQDITQGLPRVQELFEARTPKGEARMAEASGVVTIEEEVQPGRKMRRIIIARDDDKGEWETELPSYQKLLVKDGDHVKAGEQLSEGPLDPKEVLRLRGAKAAQTMLVAEVQAIYRSQGVDIHAKHIEVIIRQMMRRVTVLDAGDTHFMPGELVDAVAFREENRRIAAQGGKFADGRQMLMGITKASLATDSWLSAASFQETTKVLTEAAMNAKVDPLVGLKENVILGKLIPAGTGLARYNEVTVEPTPEAMAEMNYSPVDFQIDQDEAGLEDFVHSLENIDFGLGFSSNQ
ncbi:DNA-directed RNA polymerase subunit beta' [Actinomycetaceae bacterium WB03_NA08]|uniref:DNA-directed RNA polymerase subunit beta' n=1 Tax=Scrofimicrobium canadense TaxID=2652290 RepID=A0A6N7W8A9_9ACTO|nr:DNA-directed RNA polymerase subunit beta' [Scrofimicrobium canadense]MSS84672.1 DNA-directed RNA polymerase subunit beta' [Scrofimicrobium canadense]